MNRSGRRNYFALICAAAVAATLQAGWAGRSQAAETAALPYWSDGQFSWKASAPLVSPATKISSPRVAIKDPTIVYHEGQWHMFCTVRFPVRDVGIEYLTFKDWKDANLTERHILDLHNQYHCAPQVFYFRPHKRWYLIYQLADDGHKPPFGPCFSTTENIANPKSWSKPQWMMEDETRRKWLDFWVICDAEKAHMFYTSLDGHMWHSAAKLSDFPHGWSEPTIAIQGDIFEASHTYKLAGMDKYLTLIEAQGDSRRYYKAYLADRLEGPWQPLADTRERPFASFDNVKQNPQWTTNISHGELLRTGIDEQLEVDPANLKLLFQGASDDEYRGNKYGMIPWRLGILDLLPRQK